MTRSYVKSSHENEKGIALIFSLLMLSLLMILSLSFALDSMFTQKAAYNSANASSAGFMAQAQLKQVLLLIDNDQANYDNSRLYSHDFYSGTDIDMLAERLPVTDILDTDDSSLDPTVKVNWNYSKNAAGSIIGRTAFVVISDGKVPLDSLIDKRAGTTSYPKHSDEFDTEARIGKYVSEINVRAAISPLPDSSGDIATITDTLNLQGVSAGSGAGFDGGEYTVSGWGSFVSLFSIIDTATGNTLSTADQAKFTDNLSLSISDDEENFWADLDGNTNTDSSEFFKRFDLTRDWDTADNAADLVFMRDKILLDPGASTAPTEAMEEWIDTASDASSKGLPWLACFGYKTDGTVDAALNASFASTADRRNQIAANLKDYCDTDDRPTSDLDPTLASTTNWLNAIPAFTGNERTPYINKIGFRVHALPDSVKVGSKYDVWVNLEIYPFVELINMYGSNWSSENLTVLIEGSVKINTTIGGNSESLEHSLNGVITIGMTDWLNGYSHFLGSSSASSSGNFNLQTGLANNQKKIDVEVTEINITKVVLHNGTTSYDYTKALTHLSPVPSPNPYPFEIVSTETKEKYGWFGFAVHDPRQNLNSEDWLHLEPYVAISDDPTNVFSVTGGPSPYNGAANFYGPTPTEAPNIEETSPTGTVDLETAIEDPANGSISTAFIRNAPMESPWELGFIHRGARWQTVNLKKYVSAKAVSVITIGSNKYIAGGGAYADGDANILDQIKMTADAKSPQKINLSASDNIYFDVLFSKIRLGCDIDNSTMTVSSMAGLTPSTGAEIDLADPYYTDNTTGMRQVIMDKFETPDKVTFTNLTRASIVGTSAILVSADASDIISLGGAVTDAAQEELIGKIVNLTDVGSATGNFTIIVLAQTIKDVGGDGFDISFTKVSADETSTQTKTDCRIGTFDAVINADSNKSVYFDEITSEQKILVEGNVSGGNFKITSFKYVD